MKDANSATAGNAPALAQAYDWVTGDDETRLCKDIPDSACAHQPRNFFAYLAANLCNKIADELSSARLILPWLLGALGAPAAFAGFLVPIREAGVLLPQIAVAAWIRRQPKRQYAWLVGAVLSGIALFAMALTALELTGAVAGAVILGLLGLYSLARGICSVAAKDVLGKTVSKTRRGRLMGLSASLAGVATFAVGLLTTLAFADTPGRQWLFALLFTAAVLWVGTALFILAIREVPGATEGGRSVVDALGESLRPLWAEADFRRYLFSRALLLSLALAPPFFVLLAQTYSDDIRGLGILIIASGLGAALSAPLWGRLSDHSSRLTVALAAALGGTVILATAALAWAESPWLNNPWLHGVLFFSIAICHGGGRLGRKVYLVDLANSANRAQYVAVSNTLIGVLMLAGGAVGLLANWLGTAAVLTALGLVAWLAALYSLRLREVSG